VLADSLEKQVKSRKEALSRSDLCLVTPYSPNAGFSVGAAMGRNRLIYCLTDYAIVVASDAEAGGTWAGATETLKNNWGPVFVLEHSQMPYGNQLLLQKGALAFPHPFKGKPVKLSEWLKEKASTLPSQSSHQAFF
jgi:predicted Rossmann fold nucleotide-binding protein DprA/Smf involved in DNA uptake